MKWLMLVTNKHLDDPGCPQHGIIPWKNIFISLKLTKNVYICSYGNAMYSHFGLLNSSIELWYDKRPNSEWVFHFFYKVIVYQNLVLISLTVVR